MRSSRTMSIAAAKTWVNVRARMLVANIAQTKIGSRPQVMPGRAHEDDRHEEVDPAQDRREPEGDDRQVEERSGRARSATLSGG